MKATMCMKSADASKQVCRRSSTWKENLKCVYPKFWQTQKNHCCCENSLGLEDLETACWPCAVNSPDRSCSMSWLALQRCWIMYLRRLGTSEKYALIIHGYPADWYLGWAVRTPPFSGCVRSIDALMPVSGNESTEIMPNEFVSLFMHHIIFFASRLYSIEFLNE